MRAARVASVRVAAMSMRSKVTQHECEPCAFVWCRQSLTQHRKKRIVDVGGRSGVEKARRRKEQEQARARDGGEGVRGQDGLLIH